MTHGQTDDKVKNLEAENIRLLTIITGICTEIDYLIAAIQDDAPSIVEEPDSEVYTPRLDRVWVDAFYHDLPIARYSREERHDTRTN